MSASQSYDARTIKGRKASANPPSLVNPGHSGPTTFFLKSEKDLEGSVAQRGRKASRAAQAEEVEDPSSKEQAMGDSSFGVESLASITSAFPSEDSLSRTNSNSTEAAEAGAEAGTPARRKRKANPVHPRISAAGQRIISGSGEQLSTEATSSASPLSFRSSESPIRSQSHLRRGSAASSINLNSLPITPLKMSPHPESAMPSTPRSGSPKSFRLSDEECSVDDTGSQAVQSSGEEEDTDESRGSSMPQLVMPSIAIPSRRPFTEKGKSMGRLRVMVVGNNGTGKTSLIQSIFRSCEDIVHVDSVASSAPSALPRRGVDYDMSEGIIETYASTRPYPAWWTDFESRRMLLRRKSLGDGVLERNLCFVDTPGITEESGVLQVLKYFNGSMERTASLEKMNDSELISVLSGDGGVQIDAVLWLFDTVTEDEIKLEGPQRHLFKALCGSTNVIPLIGHAEKITADETEQHKMRVVDVIEAVGAETFALSREHRQPCEPLLVSSALSSDAETIDASVLMSSQYVQPLMPSELEYLVKHLLEPDNIARMRHLSATKFLLWRQQHLGFHIQRQALLQSPQFGHTLPSVSSTGSLLEEPSKVLVPHSSSSFYRSASPSASDSSAISGNAAATGASSYALAQYNEQTQGGAPFRQVRLAKWAQDLQRGLDNERRRYKEMYLNRPTEWSAADSDAEKNDNEKALTTTLERAPRGRLGGAVAVIDPRDPLGVLAFSQAFRRRGWFALQVAGGCGLVGAAAWWVMRNWVEVQEFFGISQPTVNTPALPAPTKGLMDYLEDLNWRGFFGWDR